MTRPASELAHLFRARRAPAAARALPKLADRARSDDWTFEQFAAALLKTEVDSRDSHGGQGRIKAAHFPARKTLEEFDFSFQTSIRRDTVLHLGQLHFLAGRENLVLLGPPGLCNLDTRTHQVKSAAILPRAVARSSRSLQVAGGLAGVDGFLGVRCRHNVSGFLVLARRGCVGHLESHADPR